MLLASSVRQGGQSPCLRVMMCFCIVCSSERKGSGDALRPYSSRPMAGWLYLDAPPPPGRGPCPNAPGGGARGAGDSSLWSKGFCLPPYLFRQRQVSLLSPIGASCVPSAIVRSMTLTRTEPLLASVVERGRRARQSSGCRTGMRKGLRQRQWRVCDEWSRN